MGISLSFILPLYFLPRSVSFRVFFFKILGEQDNHDKLDDLIIIFPSAFLSYFSTFFLMTQNSWGDKATAINDKRKNGIPPFVFFFFDLLISMQCLLVPT